VVEDLDGEPVIWRTEGSRNHWIGFDLSGTKSNRLALNTRVRVTAGDLTQTDEVRSGGSYLSQNDLRLHFGLGDRRRVERVIVAWPSGATETLTNLDADRSYCISEGAGIVPCSTLRPSSHRVNPPSNR